MSKQATLVLEGVVTVGIEEGQAYVFVGNNEEVSREIIDWLGVPRQPGDFESRLQGRNFRLTMEALP